MSFETALEELIRRVVREELVRTLLRPTAAPEPPTDVQDSVPYSKRWAEVDELAIKSGSRTYITKAGYPCKVEGEPGVWTILKIERRITPGGTVPEGTAPQGVDCNVEVRPAGNRTGHPRTVKSARIKYMRPKKE